jgi:hypothetical protein
VQLNHPSHGNLAVMPLQKRGEYRDGRNKMPAQGALADGLKMPHCHDVM